MTAILSPVNGIPISKPFKSSSIHTSKSSLAHSKSLNNSSFTLDTLIVNRARQASPVSVFSGRVSSNNENLSPLKSTVDLRDESRAASLVGISNRNAGPLVGVKRDSSANAHKFFTASVTDSSSEHDPVSIEEGEAQCVHRNLYCKAPHGGAIELIKKTSETILDSPKPDVVLRQKRFQPLLHSPEHSVRPSANVDRKFVSDSRSLSIAPEQESPHSTVNSLLQAQRLEHNPFTHRKRPSTVSSGFVHTVKTASLANTTASFFSRSLRWTHSSDVYSHRGSNPRHSVDSDRPTTTSSVDEAALHRSVKRRQVVEEIITSEEGYVADLKALVFLYSTLLASASSLSSRTRASVQRNVIDLLHLHERLLGRMHQLSFMSARRKWFDTASPRRLGINHHIRWRSLGSRAASIQHRLHRTTRSSVETSDALPTAGRARTMEPSEAAEMACLLADIIPWFDAYEEYCAKHEMITHELRRRIPAWSDYGMGIESLAKSINSIEHRASESHKALTIGDLLMKPIQRACKYPLLLAELLKQTPVVDCPDAHAEIEMTLQCIGSAVQEINLAANNPTAQAQISRRWMLHERLAFHEKMLEAHQFRILGHATHCGVLHIAYQTKLQVGGSYALCILFASHLLVAIPSRSSPKFMILAVIHLSDLKLESCTDGKGLQCHTTLFSWKLCFEVHGQLYELIMNACSAAEEEAWTKALRVENAASIGELIPKHQIPSAIGIDLKPVGVVFGQAGNLTRRLSIQRAATVGYRHSVCQVIIRGTHLAQDLQTFRQSSLSINRSQSHLTTHRTAVLAPKRSERARMESSLAVVWTRDTLPPPSMTQSRGGQIIRASAGSLVRKLSLASMHGPFGRRSASLSLNSKRSGEAFGETKRASPPMPVYQVRKDSHEVEGVVRREVDAQSDDLNDTEVDKEDAAQARRMPSVASKRMSLTGPEGLLRRGTKSRRITSQAGTGLGPEDLVKKFYTDSERLTDFGDQDDLDSVVEEKLRSRKRWSNPMGFLGEGIKHMIFSSSHR